MAAVTAARASPKIETITRKAPTSEQTDADTLTWLLTFTEAVTSVDPTDFVVSGTTAPLALSPLALDEEGCSVQWDAALSGGDLAHLNGTVTLSTPDFPQDHAQCPPRPDGPCIWGCLGDGEAMTHPGPTGTNHNTFILDNPTPPPPPPPPVNHPPEFSGSDTFSVAENTTAVGTVTAQDPDAADDVTGYGLSGTDAALFSITSAGMLGFRSAPNYEDPQGGADDDSNDYALTATATSGAGARERSATRGYRVTVTDVRDEHPSLRWHAVGLLPRPSSDGQVHGFVHVVNRAEHAGEVDIHAVDDEGERFGPVTLSLGALQTRFFHARDLEEGNAQKGLSGGVGDEGSGHWRLELVTMLDLEVRAYVRSADSYLSSIHERVEEEDAGEGRKRYTVAFFNPAGNRSRVSWLRLVNPGEEEAEVVVSAVDGEGDAAPGGEVSLRVAPGAARMVSAQALEGGAEGLEGALGDGAGKWRLSVTSDQPLHVMSLLRGPSGSLTNLSSAAVAPSVPDLAMARRWWNVLSAEQMVAALFGDMATPAQAAAAKMRYGDLDDAAKELVNDVTTELYGAGLHESVGAWWETLDCRQMRIAAGDGNAADPTSAYCAHYPGSGSTPVLGDAEKAFVDEIGMALLGRDDPGIYPG